MMITGRVASVKRILVRRWIQLDFVDNLCNNKSVYKQNESVNATSQDSAHAHSKGELDADAQSYGS